MVRALPGGIEIVTQTLYSQSCGSKGGCHGHHMPSGESHCFLNMILFQMAHPTQPALPTGV